MPTITSRPLHNTDQRLESKRISYHVLLLLLLMMAAMQSIIVTTLPFLL